MAKAPANPRLCGFAGLEFAVGKTPPEAGKPAASMPRGGDRVYHNLDFIYTERMIVEKTVEIPADGRGD